MNTPGSSVAVTGSPPASSRTAWIPAGIESCRKPAVRENTSTPPAAEGVGSGAVSGPAPQPAASSATPTIVSRGHLMAEILPLSVPS